MLASKSWCGLVARTSFTRGGKLELSMGRCGEVGWQKLSTVVSGVFKAMVVVECCKKKKKTMPTSRSRFVQAAVEL